MEIYKQIQREIQILGADDSSEAKIITSLLQEWSPGLQEWSPDRAIEGIELDILSTLEDLQAIISTNVRHCMSDRISSLRSSCVPESEIEWVALTWRQIHLMLIYGSVCQELYEDLHPQPFKKETELFYGIFPNIDALADQNRHWLSQLYAAIKVLNQRLTLRSEIEINSTNSGIELLVTSKLGKYRIYTDFLDTHVFGIEVLEEDRIVSIMAPPLQITNSTIALENNRLFNSSKKAFYNYYELSPARANPEIISNAINSIIGILVEYQDKIIEQALSSAPSEKDQRLSKLASQGDKDSINELLTAFRRQNLKTDSEDIDDE